jgi:hypothetical protein
MVHDVRRHRVRMLKLVAMVPVMQRVVERHRRLQLDLALL